MFRSDSSGGGPAVDAEVKPAAKPGPAVVSVCVGCRAGKAGPSCLGGDLIAAVQAKLVPGDEISVRPIQCLGVCKRPVTVAISAPNGYTFFFGNLDASAGAPALVGFLRSYRDAAYGFVPWRDRPEALKRALVALLPPDGWSPPDGRAPE